MLSHRKPKPVTRSAQFGLLGLVIAVGAVLSFLPPALSKAKAEAPQRAEQVLSFACEQEAASGLDDCSAMVDKDVNIWLTRFGDTITIIDRQVSVAIGGSDRGRYDRGYVVTIFYRKSP